MFYKLPRKSIKKNYQLVPLHTHIDNYEERSIQAFEIILNRD